MKTMAIPFRQLVPAKGDDVVRHDTEAAAIKALAANLETFGLIVPLLVRPDEKGEHYTIIDGNSRWAALKINKIDPEFKVDCVVDPEATAIEGSIANVSRIPMSSLDQYEAYSRLIAAGYDQSSICASFNLSDKEFRQVMALANLSPVVKEKIRAGKVDSRTAQVLTSVSDHALQEQLLAKHKDGYAIREALNGGTPEMRFAKFDKALYTGLVTQDLFAENSAYSNAGHCLDEQMFWSLQMPFVTKLKEELTLEGWSKVKTVSKDNEISKDIWKLPSRHEIAKTKREFYIAYVVMAKTGQLEIARNVMPDPEKKAELVKANKAKPGKGKPKAAVEVEDDNDGLSQALVADLGYHRRLALKESICKGGTFGGRLMLYFLTSREIGTVQFTSSPVNDSDRPLLPTYTEELGWLKRHIGFDVIGGEDEVKWSKISKLTNNEVNDALAAIVATGIQARYGEPTDPAMAEIVKLKPARPRDHFKPDQAFWTRTSRAFMLEALQEVAGKVVADRYRDAKKGDLAARLGKLFMEPRKVTEQMLGYTSTGPLSKETIAKLEAWVPAGMRD